MLSFEQGSLIVWSKRDCDPNNSPICGARKPSAYDPRRRSALIGFQFTPPLRVVTDPDFE